MRRILRSRRDTTAAEERQQAAGWSVALRISPRYCQYVLQVAIIFCVCVPLKWDADAKSFIRSVSAATNVRDTCWPPDLVLPSGLRLRRGWSIASSSFVPRLDGTTAKLVALTDILALVLSIRSEW